MLLIYPTTEYFPNWNSANNASVDAAMKIISKSFKPELVGWQLGLATSDVSRFRKKLSSLGMARLPVGKEKKTTLKSGWVATRCLCFDTRLWEFCLFWSIFELRFKHERYLESFSVIFFNETVAKHARKRHNRRYTTDLSSCFFVLRKST